MLPGFSLIAVLEVFIISLVVYRLMVSFRGTRATAIIKGLVLLLVARGLSLLLGLPMISWLLEQATTVIMVALPVVFYPELRRTLERLGRRPILRPFTSLGNEDLDKFEVEVLRAIRWFSANRIGALIVIERDVGLDEYVETGVRLESLITAELLMTTFYPNTALHDGAAIIRGDRIVAAGCFLPLTENPAIDVELGTRHRAAVGVTEESDACVIVVSEETGALSFAVDGRLERGISEDELRKRLREAFRQERPFTLERIGGELKRVGVPGVGSRGGVSTRPLRIRRLWLYALAVSVVLWILAPRPEVVPSEPVASADRPVVSAIEVRGLDPSVALVGMREWVTVELRAGQPGAAIDVDQLQVYVDLSGRGEGVHTVPVQVVPPLGVQVLEVEPQFVKARIERLIRRELPVRVAVYGLPPAARFEVVATEPAAVFVEGAAEQLDRIAEVLAPIRLEAEGTGFSGTVTLQAIDAGGLPVSGVQLTPEQVDVVIAVLPDRATDTGGPTDNQEDGG